MDRSTYIAPDSFQGEDGSEIPYSTQISTRINKRILDLQKALEFPPRAIKDGLLENYFTYCYPWDPVIERPDVFGVPVDQVSPILLQAIFLAGSRMSNSSLTYASPQDFYLRAKTLFWLDYECDPLTILKAVILLNRWNPHGPERIGTNTPGFWCRVAVSLSQQIGLHSRKRSFVNESMRRRIWWSLVVSKSNGNSSGVVLIIL
jgi:hypothetical protein